MYPALSHQDGKSLGTAVRMQPTLNIPGSVFLHAVLWGGKKEKKKQAAADCHGEEDVHVEFHRLMSPWLTVQGDNT